MKLLTWVLLALLALVHTEMWLGNDAAMPRVRSLSARLADQRAHNVQARQANERLVAEIRDLKEGREMVEERARFEMGMVKANEILVRVPALQTSAPLSTGG